MKMKRMVFVVMVGVTFAYLILGAVIFHYLEGSNEEEVKRSFAVDHEEFLREHTGVSHAQLHAYVLRVLETHGEGVNVASITEKNTTGNATSIDQELEDTGTNWDIPSSILFCLTVMSTIGYGNISPKTWAGQSFCMVYALSSIPMFATVLVGVGERLSLFIQWVRKARPWVKRDESWDSRLKSIVICALGFLIIAMMPSVVFHTTQDWSYLESLYYSVITLTTIGFGDLVPGYFRKAEVGKTKRHNLYRIVLCLWILLGLSWVALILSELSTYFQSQISDVATETQQRLSNLETIVKKKAVETKNQIFKRDSHSPSEDEAGVCEFPDVSVKTPRKVKPSDEGVDNVENNV